MATILLADDDRSYRGVLRALLKKKGHVVVEAANGKDAMRELEKLDRLPDLLILDLKMPGLGGYELTLGLRQSERIRRIPILILTGAGDGIRSLAELEGVIYLQKDNTSPEEILDHIDRSLRRDAPPPG